MRDPETFTDPGLTDDDHVSMPQGQLRDWQHEFDLLRAYVLAVGTAQMELRDGIERWFQRGKKNARD